MFWGIGESASVIFNWDRFEGDGTNVDTNKCVFRKKKRENVRYFLNTPRVHCVREIPETRTYKRITDGPDFEIRVDNYIRQYRRVHASCTLHWRTLGAK